ncbi:MAG: copper chaperone PCu(A)C [Hyphomonadaceae bacterium]
MFRSILFALAGASFLFAAGCSPAAQTSNDPIAISDAWAPVPPNGAPVAAGYMTLTNSTDAPLALTGVQSPRAGRVEVHEMTMEGAMMHMRAIPSLTIPAHGSVSLSPGGTHLMFHDMPTPFAAGEAIPVMLTFDNGARVDALLPVRAREGGHAGH